MRKFKGEVVRPIKLLRKIGGKQFKYAGQYLTSKRAKEVARLERFGGNNARIIKWKKPKRFIVYVRKSAVIRGKKKRKLV